MFRLRSLVLLLLLVCICMSFVMSVENGSDKFQESGVSSLDHELQNMTTATLINILEQSGVDIGDSYFTKEELIRLIKMQIDRDYEWEEANSPPATHKETESAKSTTTPSSPPRKSKATVAKPTATAVSSSEPSVWQQVKDQFRADIAPFLALVPAPVKAFVHKEVINVGKLLGVAVRGAVSPMLLTAAKVLSHAAQFILSLADRLKLQSQQIKAHK